MTALLHCSISSNLTDELQFQLAEQVSKNKKAVYLFFTQLPSNSKRKAKKVCLYMVFMFAISQPLSSCIAVGISPPPTAINRLVFIEQSTSIANKNNPQIASIAQPKVDKIKLTHQQLKQVNDLAFRVSSGSITIDEALLEIRGGDIGDLAAIFAFVIFVNWYDSLFTEGFQQVPLPHMDPFGWMSGKYDRKVLPPTGSEPTVGLPTTGLEMEKPALMPQPEYSALTKSEKRMLADPKGRDGVIQKNGYPRLDLRYNQIEYKTPKHGPDHNLPVDDKGKTPKTEANVLALRDSLLNMPNAENVIWYTEGQYQGGTPDDREAVNLYDPQKKLIAVYTKQNDGSYSFLTTYQLTQVEEDHLKATNGNFVTEKVLTDQTAVSIYVQDDASTTSTNNNDVNNNNNGVQ